jgi:acyl-CoA synthetase (AMP-forming)/AMP-acid ligase II
MPDSNPQNDPALTWAGLLQAAHRRHADEPAVIFSDAQSIGMAPGDRPSMSYEQLLQASSRVAGALTGKGLAAGARVVLALDNRPEMVVLERALALWGYVRVAVSPRLHALELAFIATDCGARLLVCETHQAQALCASVAELAADLAIVPVDRIDGFEADLSSLLSSTSPCPRQPTILPDDTASLMYTSGTTGRPKGAINTHRAWAAMALRLQAVLPKPGPGDVLLHAAPMSHFSGSVSSAYMTSGAAIATLRRFDATTTLQRAHEVNATCIPLVPTMLAELARVGLAQGNPVGDLRAIPYGGSPIAPATLARAYDAFGPVLIQLYGMSEALIPVTCLSAEDHALGDERQHRLSTAGRPVHGEEVRLEKPGEDGVGEICVRGPHVSSGYWNADGLARHALDDNGWLHTGDLASVDHAGRLRIVDRSRDVVISGGFNIYPAEVERVIAGVHGVADVAVIGIPHEKWGEAVAALIVTDAGSSVADEDVIKACREQIAGYKKPLVIERMTSFPKTSTGKTDKRALRNRYWLEAPRKVGE